MKPFFRRLLGALAVTTLATPGCSPSHDRLPVFTSTREPRVRVGLKDRFRAKAPTAKESVPAARSVPASNGVDVPIIEPE